MYSRGNCSPLPFCWPTQVRGCGTWASEGPTWKYFDFIVRIYVFQEKFVGHLGKSRDRVGYIVNFGNIIDTNSWRLVWQHRLLLNPYWISLISLTRLFICRLYVIPHFISLSKDLPTADRTWHLSATHIKMAVIFPLFHSAEMFSVLIDLVGYLLRLPAAVDGHSYIRRRPFLSERESNAVPGNPQKNIMYTGGKICRHSCHHEFL